MRLSVIIPAYNEEKYLPATLEAIHAAEIDGMEVIVVDNDSTDATRDVAVTRGVKVVTEIEHKIARVRNTGTESASGDVVVFIDADSIVRPGSFEKIVEAMSDERCLGGSVAVEFEPIEKRLVVMWFGLLWPVVGKLTKMRGGALQFCRADVFRELGGYDTTIYVGEDIDFHWRLDRLAETLNGRTIVIDEPKVLTSSRRWNRMGLLRLLFFTFPVTVLLGWRVRSFWRDWYEDAIR